VNAAKSNLTFQVAFSYFVLGFLLDLPLTMSAFGLSQDMKIIYKKRVFERFYENYVYMWPC